MFLFEEVTSQRSGTGTGTGCLGWRSGGEGAGEGEEKQQCHGRGKKEECSEVGGKKNSGRVERGQ